LHLRVAAQEKNTVDVLAVERRQSSLDAALKREHKNGKRAGKRQAEALGGSGEFWFSVEVVHNFVHLDPSCWQCRCL